MVYCSKCGLANRDGSRFCNACGERLAEASASAVVCPACDGINPPVSRFCGHCGGSLPPPLPATPAARPAAVREPDAPLPFDDEAPPLESDLPSLSELLDAPLPAPDPAPSPPATLSDPRPWHDVTLSAAPASRLPEPLDIPVPRAPDELDGSALDGPAAAIDPAAVAGGKAGQAAQPLDILDDALPGAAIHLAPAASESTGAPVSPSPQLLPEWLGEGNGLLPPAAAHSAAPPATSVPETVVRDSERTRAVAAGIAVAIAGPSAFAPSASASAQPVSEAAEAGALFSQVAAVPRPEADPGALSAAAGPAATPLRRPTRRIALLVLLLAIVVAGTLVVQFGLLDFDALPSFGTLARGLLD